MGGAHEGGSSCLAWLSLSLLPAVGSKEKGPLAGLFVAGHNPIDSVFLLLLHPARELWSGSCQRSYANYFLESLHFYPPICSHLAGPG